jgi:hypothetical protein
MGAGSFYYKQHYALGAEVAAAAAAARRQFPRILPSSGIYAGFSQGASMGALMISSYADQFPYVVLIEGFTQLNVALGRAFAKRGGQALLFVCGTRECASRFAGVAPTSAGGCPSGSTRRGSSATAARPTAPSCRRWTRGLRECG